MRILISGFEAFGGRELNPTALLVSALHKQEISYPDSLRVEAILLPVTFNASFLKLQEKIQIFNPDVIICFGQAAGRTGIELESVAFNRIDAEIKDNDGNRPLDQVISPTGAESYLSSLPLSGIEGALKDEKISVKVSNSAGLFVCNYLFYRLMETNQDTERLCGFIHVPLLPEQAKNNEPTMEFESLKRALSVILEYIDY